MHSKWLKDLHGAWIFYTILPKIPFLKAKFNHIARFAPYIGIVIGIIQAFIWIILSQNSWSITSIALITIAINFSLTGGLHYDGLIDTADGIAAGKDKCLEAMRDSRVGATGISSLIVIICLQIASLIKIGYFAPLALMISSFWGRTAPLFAIESFPYLDISKKENIHHKEWEGIRKEIMPSLILILISCLICLLKSPLQNTFLSLLCLIIGIIPAIIIPNLIGNKLGGHTGDSYGATLVIVETITLLSLSIMLPSW